MKRYRSTILAIGRCCGHAIPVIGQELHQSLQSIEASVSSDPASFDRVGREVEAELAGWSDRAAEYYRTKTEEVRDIMLAVARATGCIGERDQRYAKQIGDLSERLFAAAKLSDLAEMRHCLVGNTGKLKTTAQAMMQSSQVSVASLRTEIVRYETLLRDSERRALLDPLTGLENRRGIEEQLRIRIESRHPFSVLILDLNEFKTLNDTYGRVAGDDILKQFADELRTNCEHGDIAGRLGGDEFIVISNRSTQEALL